MNYFDNENNIIDFFQGWSENTAYPVTGTFGLENIFKSIHDVNKWKKWVCSSKKFDPPSDYYSTEYKLMMEVMRVDDHAHIKRGKLINPVNERESMIQHGIRSANPTANKVMVNAVTDLPTYEDHNFIYYCSNFKRTLEKHIKNIPLYRNNHPGFKLIFFVLDESTDYCMIRDKDKVKCGVLPGERLFGQMHQFYLDKRFINVFKSADIDYLIWFTPFKMTDSDRGIIDEPHISVYGIKDINEEILMDYSEDYMISTEA